MHVELGKDGFEVSLDGVGGDDQGSGNFFVGHTLGQQGQNFPLAFGQLVQFAISPASGLCLLHGLQKGATARIMPGLIMI